MKQGERRPRDEKKSSLSHTNGILPNKAVNQRRLSFHCGALVELFTHTSGGVAHLSLCDADFLFFLRSDALVMARLLRIAFRRLHVDYDFPSLCGLPGSLCRGSASARSKAQTRLKHYHAFIQKTPWIESVSLYSFHACLAPTHPRCCALAVVRCPTVRPSASVPTGLRTNWFVGVWTPTLAHTLFIGRRFIWVHRRPPPPPLVGVQWIAR